MNCCLLELESVCVGRPACPGENLGSYRIRCESCHEELERLRVTHALRCSSLKGGRGFRGVIALCPPTMIVRTASGGMARLHFVSLLWYLRPRRFWPRDFRALMPGRLRRSGPPAIDTAQVEQRIGIRSVEKRLDAQVSKALAKSCRQ